ncbi:MAG: extracellular solute-binding protein [Clostridiales bacterium]|jgi:multiple sugar transport system substrate-binding protein|nr:extracellular solute-binding protein [Clostridiales bacterium]
MSIFKKQILYLKPILLAAVILVGCAPQHTDAVSEPEQIALTFSWWGTQQITDSTIALIEKYTDLNPHITIQAMPSAWEDYYNELGEKAAIGTLPDIVQIGGAHLRSYGEEGLLADLSPYVESNVIDLTHLDPGLSDIPSGEPLNDIVIASNVLAIVYNPDVLTAAGITLPDPSWQWQDFEQLCMTVKQKTDKWGFAVNINETSLLSYWLRQSGNNLFSENGKALGYEDDQIFIDFISFFKRLVDAGAAPTPEDWLIMNELGSDLHPVITGEAAFTLEWANYVVKSEQLNPNLRLITLPYSDTGINALSVNPSVSLSVSEGSPHKAEAAAFIDWFINSREANEILKANRGIPVNAKIRKQLSQSMSPQQQEMFEYMELVGEQPATAPQTGSESGLTGKEAATVTLVDVLNRVLFDKLTPEAAAQIFRQKVTTALDTPS